jgi:hypothetical protein
MTSVPRTWSLQHTVHHNRTGSLAQRRKFFHRILGVFLVALRVHTNQNDVLDSELAVLDLGDVFEFGTETVYAPKRDAVGEIHFANRRQVLRFGSLLFHIVQVWHIAKYQFPKFAFIKQMGEIIKTGFTTLRVE